MEEHQYDKKMLVAIEDVIGEAISIVARDLNRSTLVKQTTLYGALPYTNTLVPVRNLDDIVKQANTGEYHTILLDNEFRNHTTAANYFMQHTSLETKQRTNIVILGDITDRQEIMNFISQGATAYISKSKGSMGDLLDTTFMITRDDAPPSYNPEIIVIVGPAGSGKSEVAHYLSRHLSNLKNLKKKSTYYWNNIDHPDIQHVDIPPADSFAWKTEGKEMFLEKEVLRAYRQSRLDAIITTGSFELVAQMQADKEFSSHMRVYAVYFDQNEEEAWKKILDARYDFEDPATRDPRLSPKGIEGLKKKRDIIAQAAASIDKSRQRYEPITIEYEGAKIICDNVFANELFFDVAVGIWRDIVNSRKEFYKSILDAIKVQDLHTERVKVITPPLRTAEFNAFMDDIKKKNLK